MIILFFFLVVSFLHGEVIERPKLLNKIHAKLKENAVVGLCGLGGVGKTVLSRSYQRHFAKFYKKIGWIDWSEISLDEQLHHLKIETLDLLIVDNFNARNLHVFWERFPHFKGRRKLKLLINGRLCFKDIPYIDVGPFERSESIQLAQSILGDKDLQRLDALAKRLKDYPYGIAHLSSYIKESHVLTVQRFLEMPQTKNEFKPVQETISLIKKEDPKAYEFLALMSLFSSKKIPLDLLSPEQSESLDTSIKKLVQAGLITSIDKSEDFITYDIHDLTQESVLATLTPEALEHFYQKGHDLLIRFYKECFSKVTQAFREDQIFYAHLDAFIHHFPHQESLALKALLLKRNIYSNRRVAKAFEFYKAMDGLSPETKIKDPEILGYYLIDKAFLECFHGAGNQESFQKGLESGKKAVRVFESINHIQGVFSAKTRLGWISLYQDDMENAEHFLKKAELLLHEIKDPNALKEFYFGTSWFYVEEGNYQAAKKYAAEGIPWDKVSKNGNVSIYLYIHKALAEFYLGEKEESLKTLEEGSACERKVFSGASSLARGELESVYALLYCHQKKYEQALEACEKSLTAFNHILGVETPYHPKAVTLKTMAQTYFEKGDFDKAQELGEKSLAMFQNLIPQGGGIEFAELLYLLGCLYLKTDQAGKALNIKKELLDRFGLDHTMTRAFWRECFKEGREEILLAYH